MNQTVELKVAGLPAEISKTWTHYDSGLEPWVELIPSSYGYHLKVWGGDPGETFDHPFDGHQIRWRRVVINNAGESMEYIAEEVTDPAEST